MPRQGLLVNARTADRPNNIAKAVFLGVDSIIGKIPYQVLRALGRG